jgi:hypothetical protein
VILEFTKFGQSPTGAVRGVSGGTVLGVGDGSHEGGVAEAGWKFTKDATSVAAGEKHLPADAYLVGIIVRSTTSDSSPTPGAMVKRLFLRPRRRRSGGVV